MPQVEFEVVKYAVDGVSYVLEGYRAVPSKIRKILQSRELVDKLARVVNFSTFFEEELDATYKIIDYYYNDENDVLTVNIESSLSKDELLEEIASMIMDAFDSDLEVVVGKDDKGTKYFLRVEGVYTD